jgi:hypothetical protein
MKIPSRVHDLVKRAAKLDPAYGAVWRVYAAGAETLAQQIVDKHERADKREWRWIDINATCPNCLGAVEAYFYDALASSHRWKGVSARCKACPMQGYVDNYQEKTSTFLVKWAE